jgi:hypothetical protein
MLAALLAVPCCVTLYLASRCTWLPHAVPGMHAMYSMNIPRSVGCSSRPGPEARHVQHEHPTQRGMFFTRPGPEAVRSVRSRTLRQSQGSTSDHAGSAADERARRISRRPGRTRLALGLRAAIATMIAKRSAASRLICCCERCSCSNMAVFLLKKVI